jgi:hypothetical protein
MELQQGEGFIRKLDALKDKNDVIVALFLSKFEVRQFVIVTSEMASRRIDFSRSKKRSHTEEGRTLYFCSMFIPLW